MLKLYLIIIFFVLTFNSNAEIKEKIIQNLKNTKNLDFKFEQNVNGKIENGNCTIEYPKKIFFVSLNPSNMRSRHFVTMADRRKMKIHVDPCLRN